MAGTATTHVGALAAIAQGSGMPGLLLDITANIRNVVADLEVLRTGLAEFVGSGTWNPSAIADGNEEAFDVTVTGAALGDFVTGVSFSLDLEDLELSAAVIATDSVTCILSNNTGGSITLNSGTVRVRVSSQGLVDAASDRAAYDQTLN